jgi:hypothetical protein
VAVREGKQNYTHTHAAAYTVILTSLGCLFTDSTQVRTFTAVETR